MKLEQFVKKGPVAQNEVQRILAEELAKGSPEKQLKALKATPNYNPKCPSCEKRRLMNVVAVRKSRKAKR